MFYKKIDLIIISTIIIRHMPYKNEDIESYINQLSEVEKIAYEIAKKMLGSSFNIEKSIGFLDWINKK